MLSSLATAAGLSRPKKKFHFDVSFSLEELKNLTFLTGAIFAKIRLRDGGTFSVISNSCDVKSHCVKWTQSFQFHTKMHGSPTTGELEPCCCKVSIRKETKGGKSYKKLGYVKINLAEYAGASATRKYLLESYNESKHKPDNSILRVTITLKQTSGDSLFKVPQGAHEWELSENPADEGIQSDILQFRHSYTSHTSTVSSSLGTVNLVGGGSLQDIRRRDSGDNGEDRKTNSASNLRRPSLCDVTDLTVDSIKEETAKTESTPNDHTPRNFSPRPLLVQKTNRGTSSLQSDQGEQHATELPPSGLTHHRRMGSWSHVGGANTPNSTHRRQQSLVSGHSSKSTSAYSTLSERSGGSMEAGDVDSISGSLKGRLTLLATSSRVEQSRVDPRAVIDNLFSGHTFDSSQAEGGEGGLKIYVDKNFGTVTVAGTNLNRKNTNLQAIDVNEHKSLSPVRSRKRSSHSHMSRDVASDSREASTHEQSPPPSSSSSSTSSAVCQTGSTRSVSASSTKTLTAS